MDAAHHPKPSRERAEYTQHQNDPHQPGYRRFLRRLLDPLRQRLPPQANGLDYGSGPGPAIKTIMAQWGFQVVNYDPFFAPDQTVLGQQYDFITCTEVAEHFHQPRQNFERLNRLLKTGGWLGLMTEEMTANHRFANWWYVRDPTHVCFYKRSTLRWLAHHFGWQMDTPRKNVILYHKNAVDDC
jgi:2-polyprenyl-3-methyl-5-hydroxy-6-metoxy-1,4-benzoquinol methylase